MAIRSSRKRQIGEKKPADKSLRRPGGVQVSRAAGDKFPENLQLM
jgi:hypothetical protein